MKLSIFSLILSVISLIVFPLMVVQGYSQFGAPKPDLEGIVKTMQMYHYFYLLVSMVCIFLIIISFRRNQKSTRAYGVTVFSLAILLISVLLFGIAAIDGVSTLPEILSKIR